MSGMLDHMLQPQQFTPTNTAEYVALQLSKRLGDEASVSRYVQYLAHHSVEQLVRLFYQAKRSSSPTRKFHSLLSPPES